MNEMVERVARTIAPIIVRGTLWEDVPIDEIFRRPRYSFLAERARDAARTAIAAMPAPLRYARVNGFTIREMREDVRSTALYQLGDAVLVWVNEGDLYSSNHIDLTAPDTKNAATAASPTASK